MHHLNAVACAMRSYALKKGIAQATALKKRRWIIYYNQ